MKTLALMISKKEDLIWVEKFIKKDKIEGNSYINQRIQEIQEESYKFIMGLEIDRLYFGNEFCEYLLPTIDDIDKAITIANQYKLQFTFVTPIVSNFGMEKLIKLLDYLVRSKLKTIEIVFNDWGVLNLLKTKYSKFSLIAGRLLDNMFRDPRLEDNDYKSYFTEAGRDYIRRSNITAKPYQNLLQNYNVNRVELDNVPQGFSLKEGEIPIPLSIYIPYGQVTTGRLCMMRSMWKQEEEKYLLEENTCTKQCQNYDQMMKKQIRPFKDEEQPKLKWNLELFRKGKVVFFVNGELEKIIKGNIFDRVIYQPVMPV